MKYWVSLLECVVSHKLGRSTQTLGHIPSRFDRMPHRFSLRAYWFSETGQRLHFTGCDCQETMRKTLARACSRQASGWSPRTSETRPQSLRLCIAGRVESRCFPSGQNGFAIASFVIAKAKIRVCVQMRVSATSNHACVQPRRFRTRCARRSGVKCLGTILEKFQISHVASWHGVPLHIARCRPVYCLSWVWLFLATWWSRLVISSW
jgi:hypothetical protein